MYYKNYLTTTALTVLIGSTFTPNIGMEIEQQQNQDQFERAKKLTDYFCITRFPGNSSIPVRKEGADPNGFEFYKKLTAQQYFYPAEPAHLHRFAIKELQNRYDQQNDEMKLNSMPTGKLKTILYRQTLLNRGTYTHSSDEQRKLIEEMIDILVNKEKIKPNIAENAVKDRILNFYYNREGQNLSPEVVRERALRERRVLLERRELHRMEVDTIQDTLSDRISVLDLHRIRARPDNTINLVEVGLDQNHTRLAIARHVEGDNVDFDQAGTLVVVRNENNRPVFQGRLLFEEDAMQPRLLNATFAATGADEFDENLFADVREILERPRDERLRRERLRIFYENGDQREINLDEDNREETGMGVLARLHNHVSNHRPFIRVGGGVAATMVALYYFLYR